MLYNYSISVTHTKKLVVMTKAFFKMSKKNYWVFLFPAFIKLYT